MARVSALKEMGFAWLHRHWLDETGAALVEYALLLLLIALAAFVTLVFLGSTSPIPINNIAGHINSAG